MKQLLLIDANSMVFRAYYATAYGRMMSTSSGQPTNALYGFASMVFKALDMLNPDAVLFAFDTKAKTFRHKQFEQYKGTRKELPQELIDQFALVRDYLDAFDVTRLEIEGYEADDIIGTMVKQYPNDQKIILTSDRDLLQLIDDNTSVLLMKKGITDTLLMDKNELLSEQGLIPSQIIDLKSLMGDSADNIPGVSGIGEKTAKKLLADYHTLDGVYQNIDKLKGKLKERLETQKEQAYLSYELATIYCDVPLHLTDEQLSFTPDWERTGKFFRTYEIDSLVEFVSKFQKKSSKKELEYVAFDPDLFVEPTFIMASNYQSEALTKTADSFLLVCNETLAVIHYDNLSEEFKQWSASEVEKIAFDAKGLHHLAWLANFSFNAIVDDVWLMLFLEDTTLTSLDKIKDKWQIVLNKNNIFHSDLQFARRAYDSIEAIKAMLSEKSLEHLYRDIEFKLIDALFAMEVEGIRVDQMTLEEINEETKQKVDELEAEIHAFSERAFNVNSPKQLAEVLYDQLNLPASKKRSTAIDVLESLQDKHPIIPKIMEYRKYQKFYSTYTVALSKYIQEDGKIHSDFNQCATQTGRLSSNNPNMQNISVRNEETAKIRKIFVAEEDSVLLAADYSQIELRLLAHMANEQAMIDAFNHDVDIHTKTAMDIFNVSLEQVTPAMRRQSKAVNFGIIYGMSDYGLSNQINVTPKEAATFMEAYNHSYPNITKFMDELVEFAKENGYVKTIFNRRRMIDELFSSVYSVREFGKRAAMNAPIQGSAADLIKIAMLRVFEQLNKHNKQSKLLLQVHDELVLNVKKDELEWVSAMVKEVMENVVDLKVPLKISSNSGMNWYEAK